MRIDTNISEAIEGLDRFERQVIGVVLGTMEPRPWLPIARLEATKALTLISRPEQQPLVGAFVETVLVEAQFYGMDWTMEEVTDEAANIVEAVNQVDAGELFAAAPKNLEQIRRAGDVVAAWVAKEKRREFPRDFDSQGRALSTAALSKRIFNILFGESTGKRAAARDRLLPHIQDFADRMGGSQLTPEEAEQWLLAVLNAWQQRILAELPGQIQQALADLWGRVA